MTIYITKDEYDNIQQLNHKFDDCLVACAHEICQIEHDRDPMGEWDGESEIWTDDMYHVQFETYSCGESDMDSVHVPKEFLYDEYYRDYYRKYLIRQKEMREAAALNREKNKKVYRLVTEVDERAEYERLKAKFEPDDRTNTPNITSGRCDMS